MIFQNRNEDKKIIVEKIPIDKDNHIPGEPNIFMRNKTMAKSKQYSKIFLLERFQTKRK